LSFDESPKLIAKFQSESSYKKLVQDVEGNGIIDPCLVQAYPDRLQMETGCQRLMSARQIGINSLVCFVYPWQGGCAEDFDLNLLQISSVDQLRKYFRNDSVASYLDIIGYLETGRIQL